MFGEQQGTMSAALGGTDRSRSHAARLFEEHRSFLWGLTFRLTGNAADADDIVQETFVRALARPPADQERDWRPWLVRVAVNLGRDLLRSRKRRGYNGTWLPTPVEVEPPSYEPPALACHDPAARYDLMESVSFAFLLALDALTPMQRAVLLLRDVFDYSGRETARALGISEANARTTHVRARRAMSAHDAERGSLTPTPTDAAKTALERFLTCISQGDVAAVESLLSADARALTDGGGEFHANIQPVVGRARVAALFVGLARHSEPPTRIEAHVFNGQPGFLIERLPRPGFASKFVITADVDAEGCVARIYTVLASRKLKAIHSWRGMSSTLPILDSE